MPKKVVLTLIGLDGNAFALLGAFRKAARKQGWAEEDIEKVTADAISGNYDHLLYVLTNNCIDEEDPEDWDDGTEDFDKDGDEETVVEEMS